jgi:hypothetical protein
MTFSPLNINSIGQLLQNQGLQINPIAVSFMGSSSFSHSNYSRGTTVGGTVLNDLTDAIQVAYSRGVISGNVYSELINIGFNSLGALGNSRPPTFTNTYSSVMTQWGWLRMIPWQAWKEFYINNGSYSDFCSSFSTCFGKYTQLNLPITAANESINYLDRVYSNMNDLITADICGVSLSTFFWGQDLIKSGRAIDLLEIESFGNPDALLRNLNKNKAITKSLGLALLSVGLTDTDVKGLSSGTVLATPDQQKLMYAAFCLVSGTDLQDILIPINCQTIGLETLADLINPRKLFPNSFTTLTVPVFNATTQPTNSKTYYPIFTPSGSVNSQIGARFESRLLNIVPSDIAQACGAFAVSMLQIRNIQSMSIEKFSQAVMNLENVSDLNVNGTNVPTNTPLANSMLAALALGTGERGLYTMCDFFGAMTNIHYPHKSLTDQIISLQTQKLFNIYAETLLSVSWLNAEITVSYSTEIVETSPDEFETRYRVTGFSLASSGGGYGRGGGPAPLITVLNGAGASASTVISDTRSGRVSLSQVTISSSYSLTIPTATIQSPPTALLPVQANGSKATNGTNSAPGTSGWPSMSNVVLNYVNQANTEISAIQSSNPSGAQAINNTYRLYGTYLKKEQDARALALPNIEDLTSQPSDVVVFVNSSIPFGMDTTTFGTSNVLNQIYNPGFLGGRSLVAGLREARNNARLNLAGAMLDNDVTGTTATQLPKINGKALGEYITEEVSSGYLTPSLADSGNLVSNDPDIINNININNVPPGFVIGPGILLDPNQSVIGDLIIPAGSSNGFGQPPFDNYNLNIPIEGYTVGVNLVNIPVFTGQTDIPGSFAGSNESDLIPNGLSILVLPAADSILTQEQAISEVTRCNCDCWDDL